MVAEALKHVQDLEYFEDTPFAQLPAVRKMAEWTYRAALFPSGCALRTLLIESTNIVIGDLGTMSQYQREVKFIQASLRGSSVAEISRALRLSREQVARSIQHRAIQLVARVILANANRSGSDGEMSERPSWRAVVD